jgi:hypothetical protein
MALKTRIWGGNDGLTETLDGLAQKVFPGGRGRLPESVAAGCVIGYQVSSIIDSILDHATG